MHLAIAFHDTGGHYGLFAAATVRSVLERTASRLCIHVLHDAGLSCRSRKLLEGVAAQFGQGILFHEVPSSLPEPEGIPDAYGPGSFYRYLIPDLSAFQDVSRVIYMDCDMCALLDIADLWQSAQHAMDAPRWGPQPVMALVRDVTGLDQRARLKKLGIDSRFYANSGLIVMELNRLRAERIRLHDVILGIIRRLPQGLPYPDQDALGLLCQRIPVCWLDERFNYQIHVDGRWDCGSDALEGKLVHYCGRKPWCVPGYPAGEAYMEHLRALEKRFA